MWDELERVNIKNRERYVALFRELIKKIELKKFSFENEEGEDYCIINEIRMNSQFVHLVPKELMGLFNRMRQEMANEFLGMTILVNGVRASCFGIPCSELTRAITREE